MNEQPPLDLTTSPTNQPNLSEPSPDALDQAIAAVEAENPDPQPEADQTDQKAERKDRIALEKQKAALRQQEKAIRAEAEKATREAAARAEKAERERDEAIARIKNIRTKAGIDALLSEAEVDFETVARALMGIEEPGDPAVRSLQKELAEHKAALAAEKKAAEEQRAKEAYEAGRASDLKVMQTFITDKAEAFDALAKEEDGPSWLVDRVYSNINQLVSEGVNPKTLTEADYQTIFEYSAKGLNEEIEAHARKAAPKLVKMKAVQKLLADLGITANQINAPSKEAVIQSTEAEPIPQLQDSLGGPSTKFLVNSTLNVTPAAQAKPTPRQTWTPKRDEADELLEKLLSEQRH